MPGLISFGGPHHGAPHHHAPLSEQHTGQLGESAEAAAAAMAAAAGNNPPRGAYKLNVAALLEDNLLDLEEGDPGLLVRGGVACVWRSWGCVCGRGLGHCV